MITGRREFLSGVACLLASGAAAAMRPRKRISLLGDAKLETLLPFNFAGWRGQTSDSLVQPEDEDSLAAKLYSQTVGRVYVNEAGASIMLLIAYGNTQNDLLQLHRPEVCYPAFGLEIVSNSPARISVVPGVDVPGRDLTAVSTDRTEHVLYWTRIGEHLPIDGKEQRLAKFQDQIAGIIPDGVLVRVSNLLPDDADAIALNKSFSSAMLQAMPLVGRTALIGSLAAAKMAKHPVKV